jgi:CRISPR system Cascade subunit CasD
MSGLLLHLSGPLQSWGTNSPWNHRDTQLHPTRSGLIGLLAAAMGEQRGNPLDNYQQLQFTIRIDRPGQIIMDFHTVGGGRPREPTPPLAGGGRRPAGRGTIVSRRHYLADAAFTVAVTSAQTELLDELATKLTHPVYTPYLGRRSCPPPATFLLGRHNDPITALHNTMPLARHPPRDSDYVTVHFITEQPQHNATQTHTSPTQPHRFGPEPVYEQHTTWQTNHNLPASLCAGHGINYLNALQKLNENINTT